MSIGSDREQMFGRLLDPLAGYSHDQIEDDRCIGHRRIQLGCALIAIDALAEACVNLFRGIPLLWAWVVVAAAGALFFGIQASRAQRRPDRTHRWLTEGFIVFALLCANAAGYIGAIHATGNRIPVGYPMAFLAAAPFFVITPRRFAIIGAITYIVFAGWISLLDMPYMVKVHPLLNGALAIVAGCFGRASIHRIQQIGWRHRARVIQQNEALERRNADLNDLMAITAHDLRSPLFGLRSVLDLARIRPPTTPQALDSLLEATRGSVAEMITLVTRLLDMHELEGAGAPMIEPCDLSVALGAAVRRTSPLARSSGIRIEYGSSPAPLRINANRDSVAQILDNLLSNAVRYSNRGDTIIVSAGLDADSAFVEIVDSGIGIPEDERQMIFAKFRRGSTPPPNGPKGSGLGLYIVSTLAVRMNATCSYLPNPSGGSIFRVTFTLAEQTSIGLQEIDRKRTV